MTDRTQPSASPHASHDLVSIAALAARASDMDDAEHARARALVTTCTTCADVLAELVMLRTALPMTSTPARPRDFSLTPADAARLRARGWRRFLGFFGSARDAFSRPLAATLTTLGIAGLLLASLPGVYGAGGAATILSNVGAPVQQAAPAPSAGEAQGSDRMTITAEPAASGDAGVFTGGNPEDLGSTREDLAGDGFLFSIQSDASGLSALFVVAGMLLIVGLGLFALRWSARRLL